MSSATFPESASFVKQYIPSPPLYIPEEQTSDEYLGKLSNFLSGQYVGLKTMQNSIASGWLIETLRVLDLDANTITAGTIFTQDLYIGNDGNGSIGLLGTETLIEVVDEAGTTRVQIGDFGTSNDNWGIKVNNAAGATVFQATSSTFIDGAVISNATILDAAIADSTITGSSIASTTIEGSNIANNTITDTHVGSLSATKINAGTLIVDGSPAISVVGSGACVFQSGGDILMKASGTGDDNLIELQTSASSRRGVLGYNSTNDVTYLVAYNGADLNFNVTGGGHINIGTAATGDVNLGTSSNPVLPSTDNAVTLGSASFRWSDLRSVLINGADFCYDNGWRTTEPNNVWSWADAKDGIVTMNELWEPVEWLHRDGERQTKDFLPVEIMRREAGDPEGVRLNPNVKGDT